MANPQWGRKHSCVECGAAFYDMLRSPITCPKCGVKHQPVVVLKPDGRPPRKSRIRSVSPPAPVPEPAESPADTDEPEVPELDETTTEEAEIDVDDAAPDDRDR
jgi:uncharacterized protein (TIGR02300 family)